MEKILVIHSDQVFSRRASKVLAGEGYDVFTLRFVTEALLDPRITETDCFIVEDTQVSQDPSNTLSFLLDQDKEPDVLVLARSPDSDAHAEMIAMGAWDVRPLPESDEEFRQLISQLLKFRSGKMDKEDILGEALAVSPALVTRNNIFLDSIRLCRQASRTDVNVLVHGETGTGKELFAQVIHQWSRRSKNSLVLVDCATLPDSLIESTLFGHMRGSFTGAERNQEGLIAQADGGTLFLDEVGELPPVIQKSFLRVLDEHSFRPVGGREVRKSDFRVIAATNRDLEEMVKDGLFREDLMHRLMVMTIHVPSLRNRKEDIPLLAEYHKKLICRRHNIPEVKLSKEYMRALTLYPWPGNVRELIHSLERSIVAAAGAPTLFPAHLPTHIRSRQSGEAWVRNGVNRIEPGQERDLPGQGLSDREHPGSLPTLAEEREKGIHQVEREYLEKLMMITEGRISEAVRISGLSRSRLYHLMKQHGIRRPKD